MEDSWLVLHITAEVGYYKEWASGNSHRVKQNNNKTYKIEFICNSKVYAKESNSGYLPGLYYLVL